jgi:hypothetical protein
MFCPFSIKDNGIGLKTFQRQRIKKTCKVALIEIGGTFQVLSNTKEELINDPSWTKCAKIKPHKMCKANESVTFQFIVYGKFVSMIIKVGIVEDEKQIRDSLRILIDGSEGFSCVC